MMWIWILLTVTLGVITCGCIAWVFVLAFNSDKNFIWCLLGAVLFSLATYFSAERTKRIEKELEPKYTIVSTSVLPKIDTTITYSAGLTDTVYTYYFLKEEQK